MIIENLLKKIDFKGKRRLIRMLFSPRSGITNYSKSKIYYNTFEHMDFENYWCGGYEKEITWIYDYVLAKTDVAVDVGANAGVHSILYCERCAYVHSFEPHPVYSKKLYKNLELNNFKNFKIHDYGLSDQPATVTLYGPVEGNNNKTASVYNINEYLTEKFEIKLVTLNSLSNEIGKIDFIKVDCDGSDGAVIVGASEVIAKHHPTFLFEDNFREVNPGHESHSIIAAQHSEAYQLLLANNYRLFKVGSNSLFELYKEPTFHYANILAIHKENKAIGKLTYLIK